MESEPNHKKLKEVFGRYDEEYSGKAKKKVKAMKAKKRKTVHLDDEEEDDQYKPVGYTGNYDQDVDDEKAQLEAELEARRRKIQEELEEKAAEEERLREKDRQKHLELERQRLELERRKKEEEERKRRELYEKKLREEEERRRKQEEEEARRKKEEEDRKRREEEKKKAEEDRKRALEEELKKWQGSRLMELLKKYLQRDDVDTAFKEVDEGKWKEKDRVEGFIMISGYLSRKGDLNRAKQVTKAALEKYPKNYLCLIELARILYLMTYYFEAIDTYKKVTEIVGQNTRLNADEKKYWNATCYFNIGVCQFKAGKDDEAISNYKMSLDHDDNFYKTLVNLGVMMKNRENYPEALKLLRKAMVINESDADALNDLGCVQYKMDKLDEAAISFLKAIEISPDDYCILNNLGVALSDKGKYQDAILAFDESLRIQKDQPQVAFNLVVAHIESKNFSHANELILKYQEGDLLTANDVLKLNNLMQEVQTHVSVGEKFKKSRTKLLGSRMLSKGFSKQLTRNGTGLSPQKSLYQVVRENSHAEQSSKKEEA